jgi:tRNA(Ile)-lysidine synthetase-like protein
MQVNEVSEAVENTPKCVFIDANDIVGNLRIRNILAGDTILLNGKSSPSKVSKLLINHKLSQEQKRKQLIVCDDEKIFWLVGLHFSSILKRYRRSQEMLQLQIFLK